MTRTVLIAHAEGEESIAEQLAAPLRKAGYDVSHAGTVLIGDSVVEESARLLAAGAPVVLCGTVKALGTGWAHRLVNAAHTYPGVRVFPIQVEKNAYIEQLTFDAKVGRYWQDSEAAVRDLISSLKEHFPLDLADQPEPLELRRHFEDYLRKQVSFYDGATWTCRAVALRVSINGVAEDARTAFSKWLSEGRSRVLILTGDFGSGKTWLARSFCRDLAASALAGNAQSIVPIFVALSTLRLQPIQTFADLCAIASPLGLTFGAVLQPVKELLVVLDGLDELLVLSGGAPDNAKRLFSNVAALIPDSARLVITCRTQVLDSIRNWIDLLFEDLSAGGFEDRTNVAIDYALGRGTPVATTLVIRDIEPEEAEMYLANSSASDVWRRVSGQQAFRELAAIPFTLYLLEQALPSLCLQTGVPDLPALYRAAVIFWLHRDRGAASIGDDRLLRRLEELAESMFTGLARSSPRDDEVLISAGLLQRIDPDAVTFRHFSLFEYFIARVLHRQLTDYSATLLARLNLAFMYNINRFLIPLLLEDGGVGASDGTRSQAEIPGPNAPVSTSEFVQFIGVTHWREREGFGIWTIKTAEDGTAPFEGHDRDLQASLALDSDLWCAMPALRDGAANVTGISWYDAFQYCRWAGGRLPTADELTSASADDARNSRYEWSRSWLDERCSRIAVVCTSGPSKGSVEGLNPDMRSELVGFRVVRPR